MLCVINDKYASVIDPRVFICACQFGKVFSGFHSPSQRQYLVLQSRDRGRNTEWCLRHLFISFREKLIAELLLCVAFEPANKRFCAILDRIIGSSNRDESIVRSLHKVVMNKVLAFIGSKLRIETTVAVRLRLAKWECVEQFVFTICESCVTLRLKRLRCFNNRTTRWIEISPDSLVLQLLK